MGQSIRQMMTVAGGVFFAISILCLILGGFSIAEKNKFEKELESRDPITKQLNESSGWDDIVNKPKLETLQSSISGSFMAAGVTGSIAVGLAIAGRSKKQGRTNSGLSDIIEDAQLTCCVSLISMSSLQEIESAISKLSADELAAFRAWFAEFDTEVWDRQFEEDVAAGRLNKLAERALQHLREGRCTDL